MNEDTLKEQWTRLKGTVREQRGKLTSDDVDQDRSALLAPTPGRVVVATGGRVRDLVLVGHRWRMNLTCGCGR